MSDKERHGTRKLEYSAWHRTDSLSRFIPREDAYGCAMIDVDGLEYDRRTRTPLVAVETALDVGQARKNSYVTARLAEEFGGVALTVLYKTAQYENPAADGVLDIERFRVKVCHPHHDEKWQIMTPQEYADFLVDARRWTLKRRCGR